MRTDSQEELRFLQWLYWQILVVGSGRLDPNTGQIDEKSMYI